MSMKPCPGCAAAVNASDETCHSCGRKLVWGWGLFGSRDARSRDRGAGFVPRKRAHPRRGSPPEETVKVDAKPSDQATAIGPLSQTDTGPLSQSAARPPAPTNAPLHSPAAATLQPSPIKLPARPMPKPHRREAAGNLAARPPKATPPESYASLHPFMIFLIFLAPMPFGLITVKKKYSTKTRRITGAYLVARVILQFIMDGVESL